MPKKKWNEINLSFQLNEWMNESEEQAGQGSGNEAKGKRIEREREHASST